MKRLITGVSVWLWALAQHAHRGLCVLEGGQARQLLSELALDLVHDFGKTTESIAAVAVFVMDWGGGFVGLLRDGALVILQAVHEAGTAQISFVNLTGCVVDIDARKHHARRFDALFWTRPGHKGLHSAPQAFQDLLGAFAGLGLFVLAIVRQPAPAKPPA